jgi:hypothetical protein
MSFIRTPIPRMPSTAGEISITIGTLAVQDHADKARPCHLAGTEVIGSITYHRIWWAWTDFELGRLTSA